MDVIGRCILQKFSKLAVLLVLPVFIVTMAAAGRRRSRTGGLVGHVVVQTNFGPCILLMVGKVVVRASTRRTT